MRIEQLEKENSLLREQLELIKLIEKHTRDNERLALPKRVSNSDWALITAGCGGCTPFS